MKIAFVSRGNAVRSIFAEVIAKELIRQAGLRADIYSAGVSPDKEVHPYTIQVLTQRGFPAEGLKPKSIDGIPYEELDLLITIGNEAKEKCAFVHSHKRREVWLIDEPPEALEAFRRVMDDVEQSVRSLLKL